MSDDDAETHGEQIAGKGFRIISGSVRPALRVDDEMKAMLDDLKRRYSVMRKRLEGETDAPDAA